MARPGGFPVATTENMFLGHPVGGVQRHAMGWSYFGNVFPMIFYLMEL
jgi:hypothetical protein